MVHVQILVVMDTNQEQDFARHRLQVMVELNAPVQISIYNHVEEMIVEYHHIVILNHGPNGVNGRVVHQHVALHIKHDRVYVPMQM